METLAQFGWPGAMIACIALIAMIFKSYHRMATDIALRSIEAMNNFANAVRENTLATKGLTGLFQTFLDKAQIRQEYADREKYQ